MNYKQLTFTDLAELADWLDDIAPQDDVDQTPTDFEPPSGSQPPLISPIEQLIVTRLNYFIANQSFPKPEEVESYILLDALLSKYRA